MSVVSQVVNSLSYEIFTAEDWCKSHTDWIVIGTIYDHNCSFCTKKNPCFCTNRYFIDSNFVVMHRPTRTEVSCADWMVSPNAIVISKRDEYSFLSDNSDIASMVSLMQLVEQRWNQYLSARA